MHEQTQAQDKPSLPRPANLTAMNVASLLNPVKSEPRERGTRLPSSPSPSIPLSSTSYDSPQVTSALLHAKKPKMAKDGAIFAKSKLKGEVRYPPFEQLSEETLGSIRKFQVYPMGKIQEYSRHIPYNSEKKTFLEKTGRESFEVFQYIFKVPGDDKDYTVMWDYNIGLVRITPFFKCCKYSKTTPARMLAHNPGLKEITHSITGGALAAQGYWMPYECALAICATFCHHIAAALIPIFGPSFPSECVIPEAPEHGRMVIDQHIIEAATAQAHTYRAQYTDFSPKTSPSRGSENSSRTSEPGKQESSPSRLDRRVPLKRAFHGGDSSYTDTDPETSPGDYYCEPKKWRELNSASNSANSAIKVAPALRTALPNPLLSAIPRSTALPDHWRTLTQLSRAERIETDTDGAYDGEESADASVIMDDKSPIETAEKESSSSSSSQGHDHGNGDGSGSGSGSCSGGGTAEEQKAAFWLLKLHIDDSESKEKVEGGEDGPRVKRLRAAASV